jgi:DNA-binding transcriptional regulator LsrR (DeoR family)
MHNPLLFSSVRVERVLKDTSQVIKQMQNSTGGVRNCSSHPIVRSHFISRRIIILLANQDAVGDQVTEFAD